MTRTTKIEKKQKRRPSTLQMRPEVLKQARIAAALASQSFPDWHERVLIAAIPPGHRNGLGKELK